MELGVGFLLGMQSNLGRLRRLYLGHSLEELMRYALLTHPTCYRDVYENFSKKDGFEVGLIVKWRESLENRSLPYQNQSGI